MDISLRSKKYASEIGCNMSIYMTYKASNIIDQRREFIYTVVRIINKREPAFINQIMLQRINYTPLLLGAEFTIDADRN